MPSWITTTSGFLETRPVAASQVAPVPVRPSKVMLVNWAIMAEQISALLISGLTPEASSACLRA